MYRLLKYYRLANILSLDVVAGAVISAIFYSKIFNIDIRISGIVTLGLSVWIIYTLDHLLDTYKIQHEASTTRHRFHQQNKHLLLTGLLLATVVTVSQLFFIRQSVLFGGIILSAIVAIYFVFQKYLKYVKEFFGALLYTGGVLLIPLSLKFEHLSLVYMILIFQFFITALLNLLLFSWFDYEKDCMDRRESFVTIFGIGPVKKTVILLFVINGLMSAFLFFQSSSLIFASVIILIMNLVLMFLYFNTSYFSINDRYRILGDSIFVIPIFYNFFSH